MDVEQKTTASSSTSDEPLPIRTRESGAAREEDVTSSPDFHSSCSGALRGSATAI